MVGISRNVDVLSYRMQRPKESSNFVHLEDVEVTQEEYNRRNAEAGATEIVMMSKDGLWADIYMKKLKTQNFSNIQETIAMMKGTRSIESLVFFIQEHLNDDLKLSWNQELLNDYKYDLKESLEKSIETLKQVVSIVYEKGSKERAAKKPQTSQDIKDMKRRKSERKRLAKELDETRESILTQSKAEQVKRAVRKKNKRIAQRMRTMQLNLDSYQLQEETEES